VPDPGSSSGRSKIHVLSIFFYSLRARLQAPRKQEGHRIPLQARQTLRQAACGPFAETARRCVGLIDAERVVQRIEARRGPESASSIRRRQRSADSAIHGGRRRLLIACKTVQSQGVFGIRRDRVRCFRRALKLHVIPMDRVKVQELGNEVRRWRDGSFVDA
jgi:hypothetical protein